MKYTVELEGLALVRYSIEVEAEDDTAAKQTAIELAPSNRPTMWDLKGTGYVATVRAVDCEESED